MCGFAAVMDSGGRTACAVTGRASNAVSSTPVISRIRRRAGRAWPDRRERVPLVLFVIEETFWRLRSKCA